MRVCPKCKSDDVVSNSVSEWTGSGKYKCNSCGFSGDFFPEVDDSEEE